AEAHGATTIKVLDFGIAKIVAGETSGQQASAATTAGAPAFSPDHAAPEQVTYGRTGPFTDFHALGLMLSQMLTGQAPYGAGGAAWLDDVASWRRPTPRPTA